MVYVQNRSGQPLMPTEDHRKVRLLLKNGFAVVVKRTPFTIRLATGSKNYVQRLFWAWIPAAGQSVFLLPQSRGNCLRRKSRCGMMW